MDNLIPLFESVMVKPDQWLNSMWCMLGPGCAGQAGVNLPELFRNLAMVLLLLGTVWSGLRIASLGTDGELKDFLARLLMAGALVLGSTAIGDGVRNLWVTSYKWSVDNFTRTAVRDAGTELRALGTGLGLASMAYAAAPVAVAGVKTAISGNPITALKEGPGALEDTKKNVGNLLEAAKWVGGAVMILVMVHYVVVIVSGFAILLASALIPFSGVMLIFPKGDLSGWFSMWFRTTAGAILTVLLIPVAFAAALNLGFVQPAKNYNQAIAPLGDAARTVVSFVPNGNLNEAGPYMQSVLPRLKEGAGQALSGLGGLTFGLIVSTLMMVFGIIMAVILIFAAQEQIVAFVGGAGGSSGKSAAGMALARALPGIGGRSMTVGGGGAAASGRSGGSPNSSPGGSGPTLRTAGGPGGGGNPGGAGGGRPSGTGYGGSNLNTSGSSTPGGTRSGGFGSSRSRT